MAAAVSVLAARGSRNHSEEAEEGRRAVLPTRPLQESSRRKQGSEPAGSLIDDDPRFLFCFLFYPFRENI